MKIKCDVCDDGTATIFCFADEAALCAACDGCVHQANKLAGKHPRISLIHHHSTTRPPLCDVCQERHGFIFCREDRAILCRDCDLPIHVDDKVAGNHARFLLSGVRVFSRDVDVPVWKKDGGGAAGDDDEAAVVPEPANSINGGSSISDYLTKILPGWCVEDLLADDGFLQSEETSPLTAAATADVLHVLPSATPHVLLPPESSVNPSHESPPKAAAAAAGSWSSSEPFAVPQIPPSLEKKKRSRTLLSSPSQFFW